MFVKLGVFLSSWVCVYQVRCVSSYVCVYQIRRVSVTHVCGISIDSRMAQWRTLETRNIAFVFGNALPHPSMSLVCKERYNGNARK